MGIENAEIVGEFSEKVVSLLNQLDISVTVGTKIYIGASNRRHMQRKHRQNYEIYGDRITKILTFPDYVGINPKENSIEFIKIFGKNIELAVRVAGDGKYYAHSLFEITPRRIKNYVKSGFWFALDK
jgi:hypothetical protein